MKFYKYFRSVGDTLYVVESDNGVDREYTKEVKPTLYVEGHEEFKTIYGRSLQPRQFDSITLARQFADSSHGVYGFDRFAYSDIAKNYSNEYDQTQIKVGYIDIENAVVDRFPDIETADTPINCVTIGHKDVYYCFTTLDFKSEDYPKSYRVMKVQSEANLLDKVLRLWQHFSFDIISGWNCGGYDMPYLAKRIEVVLGKSYMNKLSKFNNVRITKSVDDNRTNFSCVILGTTILDMMDLYKKYVLTPRESYRLGFITQEELKETKLELEGSFYETYTNHPSKFVLYNIIDTELVAKLEKKLSLISLAINIAYTSKTNYDDCLSPVLVWDAIISDYLLAQNIIVPYRKNSGGGSGYEGAYVKDPIRGFYEWAVSFDFESLYPRLIQTLNISPETMIAKDTWSPIRPSDIVEKTPHFDAAREIAVKYDATLCGNGAMFSKKNVGFIPVLAEMMFNKRKDAKNSMLKYKKSKELVEAELKARGL